VSDGTNARILQYDRNGKLLYWWGVYGTNPGTFWEMHQFSVDSEGNLYAVRQLRRTHAEVQASRRRRSIEAGRSPDRADVERDAITETHT
jgi:hypothetical protein